MTRHVISHRKRRRKRGSAWRRLGALAVTVAALGTASWLAPYVYRPAPPPPPAVTIAEPAPAKRPPSADAIKVFVLAGGAPPVVEARHRPQRARRGVPLDAQPDDAGEDFEILNAAELAAISQARN
jgi:hypothetical protein